MSLGITDWVGQTLSSGRYLVTARLGQGGMGSVYRARDRNLDCDVVIKVPHPAMFADPEFAGRFTREVRSLVRLAHAHIVKITDVGEHQGLPFAVMQYLSGGNLRQRQPRGPSGQRQPLPVEEVCRCLEDVAEALDFIHTQGCIHRDVKPDNILFDANGHVYLSDFGVAKAHGGESRPDSAASLQTAAGMTVGTPQYMAPELFLGQPYDGRVDQYALAVTAYELLSAQLPFTGATPAAVALQQMNQAPRSLAEVVPGVTPAVAAVVSRALAKDPQHRFPDRRSFILALRSAAAAPLPTAAGTAGSQRRTHLDRLTPATAAPSPAARPDATVRELPPIDAPCPSCGALFQLPAALPAGKSLRCPRCRAVFQAPQPAPLLLPSVDTGPLAHAATLPTQKERPRRTRMREAPAERRSPLRLLFAFLLLSAATAAGVLYGEEWYRKAWSWYYSREMTVALDRRDWERVIASADEVLRVDPQRSDALCNRAEAYLARCNFERAASDADRALKLEPKLARALALRGAAAERSGEFDRAIKDCSDAVVLDPKLGLAYAVRGHALNHLGDPARALADCKEAIQYQPKLALAFAYRAEVYVAANDPDRALEDCEKALGYDDKLALAYAVRAAAYLIKRDFERAGTALDQAERINDKEAEVANVRGQLHRLRGDPARAIEEFDRAIARQDKFAPYWSNRALARLEKAEADRTASSLKKGEKPEADQALADAEKAVGLAPKSMAALRARGEVRLYRGETDLARADADAALRLNEGYAPAYELLGRIHRRNNDNERAREAFSQAIKLDARNVKAYLGRARLSRAEGRYNEAIKDYDEALSITKDPQILRERAELDKS